MLEEQLDGLGVERDPMVGVALGVLLEQPAREVCAVLRSTQRRFGVQVPPARRAQL